MRRSLANARILLTGASSGLGRELALALAGRGTRLLLTARREDRLRQLADQCAPLGGAAEFLAGDVVEPDHRAALVSRAAALWHGLDVLINNAGVSAHGAFADSDELTLRRIMEVNFFAAAELTRLALPLLIPNNPPSAISKAQSSPNQRSELRDQKSPFPAILNIGSIIGHRGLPLNSEYAASKFALRGWTEALRAELTPAGVDVLLVSPGTIDTEFFDHLLAKRADMPWKSAASVPAAIVAEQAVRALERGRREIFPNWRGRFLVLANRLAPGLVDRLIARQMR